MPIQEPGVIVNITGQNLPPPNPPTRFGIANYVFAKDGPFKTRAILNSRYPHPFEDIVSGACLNDIVFLKEVAPIYAQILPNFGHKPPNCLIAVPNTIANQLEDPNNPKKVRAEYEKLFVIPLWLNGPPQFMAKYVFNGVLLNLPPPNHGNINLSNSLIHGGYIEIEGERFFSIPGLSKPAASGSPLSNSINVTDFARYNCVINGIIPSNTNNFSLIVYINNQIQGYTAFSMNIYMIFDFLYNSGQNNWDIELYVFTDDKNGTIPSGSGITINQIGWLDISNSPLNLNGLLSGAITSQPNIYLLKGSTNNHFDIVYFTTFGSNNSIQISPSNSTDNPYNIVFTSGSQSITNPLSYSPLHTGYYGFLDISDIEIIENGSLYDSITNPPPSSNFTDMYISNSSLGLKTDIPFYDERHDLRIHKSKVVGNSFFDTQMTTWPDENGGNPRNDPINSSIRSDYIYINKYVTRKDVGQNIYKPWIDAWNSYVIYRDTDVRPLLESPLQADLLTDYGGNISYGFTSFIRMHNKFMFKVLGTGDLTNVRIRDIYNYTEYYWRRFNLQGFHYIRLQGNSATGVSASALYCKATFDYRFNAIFGINASLSVTDVDYEFIRAHRENLLELNVNTIVMDRNLFLWYFNNNLTEEARRDDSPLGEECNARVAIRLTKLLGAYVDRYIGQPNNAVTRSRITNDLTTYIRSFMTNNPSNMVNFRVICDETNNTPADIANNILNIRVEAQFGKSIKYIVIFERVLASL